MFDKFKQRRAAEARKQAAKKRMHAEHAAGILRWLIKHPEAAADTRLTGLVESTVGKLTDEAFDFEDARDALYAAAGYAKGAGNEMWSAAASDAIHVLESSYGGDPERRHWYRPNGTRKGLGDAMASIPAQVARQAPPVQTRAVRPKLTSRPTRVYVIKSSNSKLVKIGYAVDPQQRAKDMQTGNPGTLTVAWSCSGRDALERLLHHRFAQHRKNGEWFDLTALGNPADVVRDEVDRIRKEATDKGYTNRYFYED